MGDDRLSQNPKRPARFGLLCSSTSQYNDPAMTDNDSQKPRDGDPTQSDELASTLPMPQGPTSQLRLVPSTSSTSSAPAVWARSTSPIHSTEQTGLVSDVISFKDFCSKGRP